MTVVHWQHIVFRSTPCLFFSLKNFNVTFVCFTYQREKSWLFVCMQTVFKFFEFFSSWNKNEKKNEIFSFVIFFLLLQNIPDFMKFQENEMLPSVWNSVGSKINSKYAHNTSVLKTSILALPITYKRRLQIKGSMI